MKQLTALAYLLLAAGSHAEGIVYNQPHNGSGTVLQSSWLDPDGYDADYYIYDNFTLAADTDVAEVRWRGGYKYGGMYGKLHNFSVFFFVSTAGDTQPLCGNPHYQDDIYLARYLVNSTANEAFAGSFGGVDMYDYSYALPQPLHLSGGVKYWIRVLAYQPSVPDWGYARADGPDSLHFYFNAGAARFGFGTGDCSFTLFGTQSQSVAPSAATMRLGKNTSGTVTSLALTDNVDYVACKFLVPNIVSPFVSLELDGITILQSITGYTFDVRAHMLHAGAFSIELEAYNFVTGNFDTSTTSSVNTSYSTPSLTLADPVSYVGSSGEVRSRVRVRQVGIGAVTAPCIGLDRAGWTLTN